MPKPEPTWAQKAQACKSELDGCLDQLERFKGMERELAQAQQELEQRVNSSPDLPGLTKQVEFYKREVSTTQQREAALQGRVQRLENTLRELKPRADMLPVVEEHAAIDRERANAAVQQAQEARRQLAGAQQRLQQFQSATEALGRMEQAADEWQRKATVLARENSELRQEVSALPELRAELAHLSDKLNRAGEHIQRTEARLAEVMPAARALPTIKADLVQATGALEKEQRRAFQIQRELDQARQQQADVEGMKRELGDKTERLRMAAEHIARKEQELAGALAELGRLRPILADLKAQVNRIPNR